MNVIRSGWAAEYKRKKEYGLESWTLILNIIFPNYVWQNDLELHFTLKFFFYPAPISSIQ